MSVLVVSRTLRTFVNTLTPDDKYSLGDKEISPQPIQLKLSEKLNAFCQAFTAFLKSTFNFEHFEENLSLIAYVFPKS